ncbi:MAG TPA: hypothetical protein VKV04_01070 [Verrucomicrobiae bacterium]|nr:hypothetical protein [Verrucomicrobiae bacterium]
MNLNFDHLRTLLRIRADDPTVTELTKRKANEISRVAHTGYVDLFAEGISVMFKEAAWVVPESEITDPKTLYLDAFHFRCGGQNGYSQYKGEFPQNLAFGDSRQEIERKLGKPSAIGGGGYSKMLKKPIPYWIKYSLEKDWLHLQLDANGNLEMVTLHVPDLQKLEAQKL